MRTRILSSVALVICAGALSGTSCPLTPGDSSGFPKTAAWTRQTINTGVSVRPVVVAAADFDGDGRLDVAAGYTGGTSFDPAVYIFFQNSTTDFTAVRIGSGTNLAGVAALAIGDLDGDARLDVLAACNGRLVYLHSPSAPRQQADWSASVIAESSGTGINQWNDVAIANLDGANGPDIVACNPDLARWSWFRSPAATIADGTGWTRVDVDTAARVGAASVAVAQFDSGDRLDVVSTSTDANADPRIAWYRNPADPTVPADWTKFSVGNLTAASRLAIADLDANGRSDVIGLNGPGRQIGWYVRPTDATTDWPGYLLAQFTSNTPVDVRAADLDANGQIDVVVGTSGSPTFRWFTPVPGGTQIQQWLENNLADLSNLTPGRFALGDIDGDGRPDVIAPLQGAAANQDLIAWFENPE